jgi:predicted enzyme related to lactoylglutathione lyase
MPKVGLGRRDGWFTLAGIHPQERPDVPSDSPVIVPVASRRAGCGVSAVARAFVPMLHVADIARAAAFYAVLGFEMTETHREPGCEPDRDDETVWAWLENPGGATLMLVRADSPIDDTAQGVLFYLYCDDVAAMRDHVLAAGVDAGPLVYPFYRPKGEFRVTDPDGYVSMVTHEGD